MEASALHNAAEQTTVLFGLSECVKLLRNESLRWNIVSSIFFYSFLLTLQLPSSLRRRSEGGERKRGRVVEGGTVRIEREERGKGGEREENVGEGGTLIYHWSDDLSFPLFLHSLSSHSSHCLHIHLVGFLM